MMFAKRTVTTVLGEDAVVIVRSDGAQIPHEPLNADYQDYLAWVAAGNTAQEWQPEDVD